MTMEFFLQRREHESDDERSKFDSKMRYAYLSGSHTAMELFYCLAKARDKLDQCRTALALAGEEQP